MNNNIKIWFFIIVIITGIWIFKDTKTINNLRLDNEQLENELSDYQYALQDANNNIEEANSIIEEAQWYAWESYEEMGYALENLTTVDTISEP
mgnify:CR=1 FL=1